MAALSITWLGHSTFIITTPGGKRIVTDPWLEGNPKCPPDRKRIDAADVILLTHGHSDHSGDVVSVSRATNAPILAIHELSIWLEQKGLQNVQGMGIGGTVSVAGLEVTMTPAVHSSSVVEGKSIVYLGNPAGFVVKMENSQTFYFAGDTALFGDMRLIGEEGIDVAILPIGDHFTMGPDDAARAAEFIGAATVIPCHYNTFPPIRQDPEAFRAKVATYLPEATVLILSPNEPREV
jgi:L-ascorbate metabolism protein UlaG (beta-lactamase superfamily)